VKQLLEVLAGVEEMTVIGFFNSSIEKRAVFRSLPPYQKFMEFVVRAR
jgi:hypothetical protein